MGTTFRLTSNGRAVLEGRGDKIAMVGVDRWLGGTHVTGPDPWRWDRARRCIVKPGSFVRCAVSGVPIPLEELKYWDVELQEAYANPEAVLTRHFPDAARGRKAVGSGS